MKPSNTYKPATEWNGRVIEWDSVFEFVEAMADPDLKAVCEDNQHNIQTGMRPDSFNNRYDVPRILETMKDGSYPHNSTVRDLVDEIETDVEIEAEMTRKVFHRQEFGDELDAMAVMRRDADGWSEIRRIRKKKPIVRVLINGAVLGCRKPQDLLYRGAAAVALSDYLESQGYAVELKYASFSNRIAAKDPSWMTSSEQVILKHADMPLDMEAITIASCEIGFFRSVCFRCRVSCLTEPHYSGMGCTTKVPEAVAEKYDFVLDSDILSKQDAINYLKAIKAEHELGA